MVWMVSYWTKSRKKLKTIDTIQNYQKNNYLFLVFVWSTVITKIFWYKNFQNEIWS